MPPRDSGVNDAAAGVTVETRGVGEVCGDASAYASGGGGGVAVI